MYNVGDVVNVPMEVVGICKAMNSDGVEEERQYTLNPMKTEIDYVINRTDAEVIMESYKNEVNRRKDNYRNKTFNKDQIKGIAMELKSLGCPIWKISRVLEISEASVINLVGLGNK